MRHTIAVACFALFARGVFACSCPHVDFLQDVSRTDAIFTATIISKRIVVEREFGSDAASVEATARVGRIWKGNPTPVVRIRTGLGGGDCGTHLNLGDPYLLFGLGEAGEYRTSSCMRTQRLAEARRAIEALAAPKADHGAEGVPPALWSQPLRNVASVIRLVAAWARMFMPPLTIVPAIATLVLLIVAKRKVVAALTAWLMSIAHFASLEAALEFPVSVWIVALVVVAVLATFLSKRAVFLDSRAFLIAAPAMFAALLIVLAWPREGDFHFSLLELLLSAWFMPKAALAVTVAIAYIVLALLWHASTSRRWSVAIPGALMLAVLALPLFGPWPLVLDALA